MFSGTGLAGLAPLREMTVGHAIHLLHMHKHAVRGLGRRPGLPPREPGIEEVRAEVVRRIAVLERQDRS